MTDERKNNSHPFARPLLLLVGARAVNQLGAVSLPFLAVLLVTERGASLATAGFVVAAFGAATIPSRLVGGRLSATIGARATIVLGLVGCATAQVAIAASRGLVSTLVAVTALGLAFEIYEPASQALIADLTAPAHRPRAFGLLGAALSASALLGGLLANALGGLDLRLLFLVDAATCVLCAGVVRLALPRGTRTAYAGADAKARAWRDPRLRLMLGAGIVFATLYLLLLVALPLTLVARGLPAARYGVVLAVAALVVVAAQPLLGRRLVPREPFAVMSIGYALFGAGLVLTAYAASLGGFLVATVLWSLGEVLLIGHPLSVVAGLAPPGSSARYLAVYGTCWGVAGVLAPLLGTAVLDSAGPRALWVGAAVVALALSACQPALRHHLRRLGPPSAPTRQGVGL